MSDVHPPSARSAAQALSGAARLRAELQTLPASPGVDRMENAKGDIL